MRRLYRRLREAYRWRPVTPIDVLEMQRRTRELEWRLIAATGGRRDAPRKRP